MCLPIELVACILKIEGTYFFWKQNNQLQNITKLNEMLTLHKDRVIKVFENFTSYLQLELYISKTNSYVIRRYDNDFGYNFVFKRNHGVVSWVPLQWWD
jgi:hypothetical protein